MAGTTPPGDPPWDATKVPEKSVTIVSSNRLTQSWPGPRTVSLQRCDGGFGFTLRHFIVYPPESSKNQADSHGSDIDGREKTHLLPQEPMDTIFVKHVKDGSPAQRAGLNNGDRVVSVNGETIAGKSYPQVVQLIQRSGNMLQLLVVPKEDDILQLCYSSDVPPFLLADMGIEGTGFRLDCIYHVKTNYFPGTAYRSSPDCHHLQESNSPCMNSSSTSSQQSSSSASTISPSMAAIRMDPTAQSHAASAKDKRTFVYGNNSSHSSDGPPPADLGRRRFSELPSMFRAEVATIMPTHGGTPQGGSTWSVASMGLGLGLGVGLGLGSSMDGTDRTWSNCDLSSANASVAISNTTVGGTRPTYAPSSSSSYYSPAPHYESHTKPWPTSSQGSVNQLPPLLPCPPAREYTTSEFGRKAPLRHDGPYASVESMQSRENFNMSQDSLSMPSGTPPPPSLSASSSREPSIERPDDATDNIINRLKASFEKKEEFLLRTTHPSTAKCDSAGNSFPSPFSTADNGTTVVKEYYPHPQRFADQPWPPSLREKESEQGNATWASSTETITHDSAIASPSSSPPQSAATQSQVTCCPVASSGNRTTMMNQCGDAEDGTTARPGKAFVSSLTRIQENIPTSELRHQPSQIRPLESNGHIGSMSSLVKAPLLGGRILKNAPLRKACSLDSELLPSRSQGSGSGSGGSTTSVDNNPDAVRMSALHLVSQRARQFELGALEQEANNRMNFYKNELARLTTRGQTPKVSDRAAQFESLSTSQETLGSESDYCPSPRQKATVESRKDAGLARLRSYADGPKNCASMASAVVSSGMIPMTAASPSMDSPNSMLIANRGRHDATFSGSDPSLIDDDLQRHRAVRQNSYLAAVKAPYKDHDAPLLTVPMSTDTNTNHHHHHHRHLNRPVVPTTLTFDPAIREGSVSAPATPSGGIRDDCAARLNGGFGTTSMLSISSTLNGSAEFDCMSTPMLASHYSSMLSGSHSSGTAPSSTLAAHLAGTTVADVILRRKAIYEEEDDENRAVRRVSYLKATSGECIKSSAEINEHERHNNSQQRQQQQHFETKSCSHAGSRSQSIQKLKAFFGERTPQIVEATERKSLQEYPSETSLSPTSEIGKEGWLHCKLAAYDGKKATDRSWKQMWAVLKGSSLYLYKDKKDVASQTLSTVDELPIDLKCCQLVDVANDYTKKKHVFRLITSSGSEYLLQADSNSDMQRWIRIIQENLDVSGKNTISQGIVMRKSALFEREIGHLSPQPGPKGIKKLTTFRNRSPTGHSPTNKARKSSQGDDTSPKSKTWRGKMVKTIRKIHGTSPTSSSLPEGVTIGIPLDECPSSSVNEFVPLLVELCTSIVEARGLEVIGIYRVPGNTAAVSFLLDAVNHGFESLNLQDPKWNDVNVISSLLKAFFRKLPEPLVTCELYPLFIEASKVDDPVQRMYDLKKMLHDLPEHNYETLKYLMRHLQKIVAHKEVNKMEARNLAIVFGPTLVRAADDNMVTMVTDMSYQCRIVEIFITHADWFFSTDENEDITNRNFPLSSRDVDAMGKPLSNQNLLLNNLQKMEHVQAELKMKDVSAKDLVSSIIGAANRKVRQKMKKHMHTSHEEPCIEERDIDREIELRLRHLKPDAGMETKLRNGAANGMQKANGTRAERRHSEDSSTSSLSTRTPSEDCTSPRKMSVDSLDSLQGGPLKIIGGDKERIFCVVRQASNKRSTWNGMQPDRDYSVATDQPVASVKRKDPTPEKQGDEGVLKTYAGLSANMQERIRQFELETKALLQRDLHRQKRDTEQRELDRQRIEMEWQKAKKDLEQDDFLDQLADNPSVAKKISDITQKIQSLQNSHMGQWNAKDPAKMQSSYSGMEQQADSSHSSLQSSTNEPTGRRDWLTHGCHPLPQSLSSRNSAAMKRVSSVESFVGGQGEENFANRMPRSQGRMWSRANSRRRAVNPVPPNNNTVTDNRSSTSLQPTAKWCGSLDSLREFYEQTAQEDAGKNIQPALQSAAWPADRMQPRVPPYQPPPNPGNPPRLPPTQKYSQETGRFGPAPGSVGPPPKPGRDPGTVRNENLKTRANDGETSFQRNENTLITATMSTTKHTISTTSSTAVMTATIVARSSKPTTTLSSAASGFKGNCGPIEGSKEKKGESQKRMSQAAVCENGFKKGRASPPPALRKSSHLRNLKRRHTVGGTKDFEKFRLLVGSQFDKQDAFPTNSSAWERLRPAVPNEDRSMKSWLRRERLRTSSPDLHGQVMVVQPFLRQQLPKSQDLMDVDISSSREEKRPSNASPKLPPALESQV